MRNASVLPPVVSSSAGSVSSARSVTNKRQQQLYSPGSGPLRKTELTASNRSLNNQTQADSYRGGEMMPGSGWRPEPNHPPGEEMDTRGGFAPNAPPINRTQRDTRSVEPRFVGGSKKPSLPSLSHLENLPPRLQKKTLQDLGLPPNYLEIMRAEQQQAMSQTLPNRHSSRHGNHRGRSRYSGSSGGGGGNQGAYYANAPYGAARPGGNRPTNDDDYSRPRSRSSEIGSGQEKGYGPRRGQANREQRRLETGSGSRNSSCDRKEMSRGGGYANEPSRRGGGRFRQYSTDSNRMMHDMLGGDVPSGSGYGTIPPYTSTSQREYGVRLMDWADEDGMESNEYGSLRWQRKAYGDVDTVPPTNSKHNRNRSRNRSTSRTRNDYYDEMKPSYPHRVGNRSRRNSQSSNVSRENSSERSYSRGGGLPRGHYRDTSSDRVAYEAGGRFPKHNRDRFANRSRDNSMNRKLVNDGDAGDWRTVGPDAVPLTQKTDRAIAEMTKQFESSIGIQKKAPGVLVIPSGLSSSSSGTVATAGAEGGSSSIAARLLFDPKNPSQPIVVTRAQSRPASKHQAREGAPKAEETRTVHRHQLAGGGPAWYNPDSPQAKLLRQKDLMYEVVDADLELQELLESGNLFTEWDRYVEIRRALQALLEKFLVQEMRFAQDVNLEHHFWKLLFYGIIEQLRKRLGETQDEQRKQFLQERALEVVESGSAYFEGLLTLLEREFRFRLDQYIGVNAATSVKGLRYALALVSSQKIFLFLGDLARYREQITEGHNFRKAKQWYVKAQQILPKNGRPYNQLALLSVYAKRKIDAVYFYMRSLMSSNPFESARESLMDLFNETKKKFENNQRKREEKLRAKRKDKEPQRFDGNLRREIWIHPEGGSRVHRTGPLYPMAAAGHLCDTSDEEDSIELNKRFIISFLHVLGKLITKTGMETFAQCAHQMLREFRSLMQIKPIAVTSYRLLQLMSLNMFAIEMTKLKDASTGQETRSELQECALSTGLLMFGILLERFIRLIQEALGVREGGRDAKEPDNDANSETPKLILPEDAKVILPAIKVWCDWMMSNTDTWNPPPCCVDYKIGNSNAHDPWSELAVLMNILKCLDTNRSILSVERKEGYETVRLPEDITLAGFTPLMYYEPEPIFVHPECDMEEAQNVLRIQKLLYFGTDRLCHCDPPVLRREQLSCESTADGGGTAFYSVVSESRIDRLADMDILLESFSDDEVELADGTGKLADDSRDGQLEGQSAPSTDGDGLNCGSSNGPSSLETRKLLRRKDELERKQRMQEKHNQRVQEILSQSTIAVSIEVHPRFLVPDTNCFVDYLPAIELIAKAHPLYQLMVPIIVINELEGLSKGVRNQSPKQQPAACAAVADILAPVQKQLALPVAPGASVSPIATGTTTTTILNLQHAVKVAELSKKALQFIKSRNPALKCVTTKGSILKTSTFTVEDDVGDLKSNDDRILETALNLCRHHTEETRAGTRYITLDVVLLTTDRNLRVKAISNDLPVREIPDFIKWAGLSA